jgi:outer membrane protein assembly factor BamB
MNLKHYSRVLENAPFIHKFMNKSKGFFSHNFYLLFFILSFVFISFPSITMIGIQSSDATSLVIPRANLLLSGTLTKEAYSIYLPILHREYPVLVNEWAMLAANPQRTSWTPEEVRGNLQVEWYRPIEPYIPYKVQPIAAGGKIFVSTARGLYAFQASDGALSWVYPTELPLGHSPTIVRVGGKTIAYVGGYDRKIHAVDTNTGRLAAGYVGYEAGAGFETNPLVINNIIYAGSRDGNFYALDAYSGELIWKYETEGPILFSAAYKDGTVYFASNDGYAYALDTTNNGSLIWKSGNFPGAGFHSYWPVVYTEKTTQKDYVIFTGGENYLHSVLSVTGEETQALFENIPVGELIGPTSTAIPGNWAEGTIVMNAGKITDYYEERPDRRTVFVLDADTGVEFTFDSDSDGKLEYAPYTWSGVTHSGNKYPPVINGVDGVYYQATAYYSAGWVSRGGPVGWKFGTNYVSKVHTPIGHASDEPMAYSSGGRVLYWSLCCDREAGSYDITMQAGMPNREWSYWGYNLANNVLAPGYQEMYNSGNPAAYNNPDGWQIYSGKNRSKNGIYGKHGSTQSPPVPYRGKLYVLKGNALFVFSTQGTNPKTPLPLVETVPVQKPPSQIMKSELNQRLESEVRKILAAGPLRPGHHAAGFIDIYGTGRHTDEQEFGEIFNYFQNPADTVYTLLLAYPHLTSNSQSQVKNYLQTYYGPGTKYDFTKIVHIGWGGGASREAFDLPSEFQNQWGQPYRPPLNPSTEPMCGWCGYWQHFPPFSFYAAWQYASIIGNNDQAFARNIFDQMSGKLEAPLSDSTFIEKPYWLNLYIAGYYGYLELQKLAGYPTSETVQNHYHNMLNMRSSSFSKDTPYPPMWVGGPSSYNNTLAISRNFMFLTPELADYLNKNNRIEIQEAVEEYHNVAPYWFVSKFDSSYGEGTFQHLYDYPSIFQTKAYILKEPFDHLAKWIDVPAFQRGDLFYIQNLVAALRASQ